MSTLLLKGKYTGSTFEEVLDHDLNYCDFISKMKFVSKELKDFKDWLAVNLPAGVEKHRQAELARINKQLTQ